MTSWYFPCPHCGERLALGATTCHGCWRPVSASKEAAAVSGPVQVISPSVGGVYSAGRYRRWLAEVHNPAVAATADLTVWRHPSHPAVATAMVAAVPTGYAARAQLDVERDNFVYSGTPWTGPFATVADAVSWARDYLVACCRRSPKGHVLQVVADLIEGQASLFDEVES